MEPSLCYSGFGITGNTADLGAIWVFATQAGAKEAARFIRRDDKRASVRVRARTIHVDACTVSVWCVVIRHKKV